MKKIKIITDSKTFEEFVNHSSVDVIQIDVKGCEQSIFAQENFIAVVFYNEIATNIPEQIEEEIYQELKEAIHYFGGRPDGFKRLREMPQRSSGISRAVVVDLVEVVSDQEFKSDDILRLADKFYDWLEGKKK